MCMGVYVYVWRTLRAVGGSFEVRVGTGRLVVVLAAAVIIRPVVLQQLAHYVGQPFGLRGVVFHHLLDPVEVTFLHGCRVPVHSDHLVQDLFEHVGLLQQPAGRRRTSQAHAAAIAAYATAAGAASGRADGQRIDFAPFRHMTRTVDHVTMIVVAPVHFVQLVHRVRIV